MSRCSIGDSITNEYGVPAGRGYVSLLANELGPTTNNGLNGAMVPDRAAITYAKSVRSGDVCTLMLGANDERILGSTRVGMFGSGLQALMAWLACESKQIAMQSGSYSGSWSATGPYGIGKNSSTQNDTATFDGVSGNVIYLGMIQQDGTTGQFAVTIDGVLYGPYSLAAPGIGSVGYGPSLYRFAGLASGSHTVVVKVTSPTGAAAKVYVDWVAGNDQTVKPKIYVSNIIRQSAGGYALNGGSDATVAAFNAEIASRVAQLVADGLNVVLVDNCSDLNQTTDLGADGCHPTEAGHEKIKTAFLAAMGLS